MNSRTMQIYVSEENSSIGGEIEPILDENGKSTSTKKAPLKE